MSAPSKLRAAPIQVGVTAPFWLLGRPATLGLKVVQYGQLSDLERIQEYPRTQEIAEACSFLGADGILVPSARDPRSKNLVVFCDQDTRIEKEVVRNHGLISFR